MRIQNTLGIGREEIIKFLVEGICQVSFIKVKDGSNRAIYCTLNSGFIPKQFENSITNLFKTQPNDPDIMPIWDVVEGKWKSFRISKMNFFLTSEEFLDENKQGHSVPSQIRSLLEKRKNLEIDKFTKRVQDLKEKAKEARKTINGELENED